MSAPLLQLQNVRVGYGTRTVLAEVNLSFQRGTLTALLGANGSGKSTLLRTLLGIVPRLDGELVWGTEQGRRGIIGYVPQQETLDPIFPLSAFEVALQGACGRIRAGRPVPRAEREWTRACLAQSGAAELAQRAFAELSGGQKQRVLIARALATRPDLLVLDEPATGLDAGAAQALTDLLAQFRAAGRTIVMVTHDLTAVRQHADSVVWLHDGRAEQGPVQTLLTREKIEQVLALALD